MDAMAVKHSHDEEAAEVVKESWMKPRKIDIDEGETGEVRQKTAKVRNHQQQSMPVLCIFLV